MAVSQWKRSHGEVLNIIDIVQAHGIRGSRLFLSRGRYNFTEIRARFFAAKHAIDKYLRIIYCAVLFVVQQFERNFFPFLLRRAFSEFRGEGNFPLFLFFLFRNAKWRIFFSRKVCNRWDKLFEQGTYVVLAVGWMDGSLFFKRGRNFQGGFRLSNCAQLRCRPLAVSCLSCSRGC